MSNDLSRPTSFELAGGEAVAFSGRHPFRDSPNEDAALVVPLDGGRGVLAVADGVGGMAGGASAATEVVRRLEEALDALEPDGSIRVAVLDALEAANRAVIGTGGATTVAAVELHPEGLRPFHIGDSEIVLVGQRGRLKLQIVPHSPVGYAVESGLLDEDDALHHDERHIVSNVLGAADMRIEVGSPLRPAARDTLLLGTDGLFDNMRLEEIVDVVRAGPLQRAAERLCEIAGGRMREPAEGVPSKPDDLTFVIWRPSPPRRS